MSNQAFFGDNPVSFIALGSNLEALTYLAKSIPGAELPDSFYGPSTDETLSDLAVQGPVLLIGSPRHNPFVDDLQKPIDTPFQFVAITPELPPDSATLCIQENTGLQFDSSIDRILGEIERSEAPTISETEYDYAIVLTGDIELETGGSQRIIWVGGIHRVGTMGASKWLVENLDSYDWDSMGNVCFLVRVAYQLKSIAPEIVQGPKPWQMRQITQKQTGILFDLGNVLLPFNRKKLEINLRNLLNVNLDNPTKDAIKTLQVEFESGRVSKQVFIGRLNDMLKLPGSKDDLLELAWCDIFWRNEPLIEFLKRLLAYRPDIKLVLISNTDEVILEYSLTIFELNQFFAPDCCVASFQPDVNPKGKDLSMLHKAHGILRQQFGSDEFQTVYVDDVRNYVNACQQANRPVYSIHYRTFPKLIFDLRKCGIYLPIS